MENKNIKIVPVISYKASKDKHIIYKDNKYKSGIYRWNNLITGKSYVGSSKCLGSRLSTYYSRKAMLNKLNTRISIIFSALLKHGYYNFTVDILEYCEIDVLVEREQYYIDLLKPEYNILKAANSRIGSKHSLKTRALMSLKLKGINHPFFGKTLSLKTRMRISESNKVYWSKVKIKRNIKPKTSETLLKMSLRSHGVSVKVFDESNNLVKIFPTIISAAKHFGLASTTMSRIEKKGTYNNFTFKFEEKDCRIWVYNYYKKLVKVFNNNKEIKELYNIPTSTLNKYIRSGKLYNDKFYLYNISSLSNLYLVDEKPREVEKIKKPLTEQTISKLSLRTQGVIVNIYDIEGNIVGIFPTISSAAKYMGVSNWTISNIPNNSLFKDHVFKFEEKDTRVWVYNSDKELVKIFKTTKETCEWYNILRNSLNGYIRSGKLYKKDSLYFHKMKLKSSSWLHSSDN